MKKSEILFLKQEEVIAAGLLDMKQAIEVAEYTFSDLYFRYEQMKDLVYHPPLPAKDECILADAAVEDITVQKGDTLTTITWHTDQVYRYVWMSLDSAYDMQKVEGGYQVTVETKRYESAGDSHEIYVPIT